MTQEELQVILDQVTFQGEKFVILPKGDGFLIQLQYMEADINIPGSPPTLQKARKWYVSSHSTESEVVQTCLLACLTSMEHRTREHFLYRGHRLYSPHINVKAHIGASAWTEYRPDTRRPVVLPCGCSNRVLSVAEGWKPEYGHPSLAEMQQHDAHREQQQSNKTELQVVGAQ